MNANTRFCGVQRQKEAQEAQAAQEARHEQAKRRAKLEAGFEEVRATALIQQQWLMTAAHDCCLIMVHDCCSISSLMFVLHDCSACLCRWRPIWLHQSGRALLILVCIARVG